MSVQVYTTEEVNDMLAALTPTPTPPAKWSLPCAYQLFGPIPGNGLTCSPFGTEQWQFVTALTANTKLFDFEYGCPAIDHSRWLVVWTPNNIATEARLVAFDYAQDSGHTLHGEIELATIKSEGNRGPTPQGLLVTDQIKALIDAKVPKHIGYQLKSATEITLYEVRLEINWRL